MSAMNPIYRADVVGSMLRPPELVDGRAAMRAGRLLPDEYKAIEDRAVDTALRIQEEAGVDVVTDGEQRRDIFFDFFISGISGMSPTPGSTIEFHGATPEDSMAVQIPFSVTERIKALPCPALAEFAYAVDRTERPVKITLPSPMLITGFWGEISHGPYPDPFQLAEDATVAVAGWMRELSDAGCRYIQIDAPELAEIHAESGIRAQVAEQGIDPERFMEIGTQLVASLGDVETPGAIKAMHVCKGNGTRAWLAEGGYGPFAEHVFARASGFDVFHLEYDDERSGDFEPLAKLPDEKVAVLGLVSTKWTELEDRGDLKKRIGDAARFHPKEHLALATQCGFASAAETAEARKITPQTQADKLRLVAEIAHEVWS
jgi:5-methyltetrahydropteroyltriglutamate--homocysteine methyltransferase